MPEQTTKDIATFEASIPTSDIRTILDSVNVLVDECKLHIEADGIGIRAIDPANVGMVDLSVDNAAFDSYETTGITIGVRLKNLTELFSVATAGDQFHLHLDEETNKLIVEVSGVTRSIALVDPDSVRQEPDLPDLDLSSTLFIEANQLNRGIKAADMVSDQIALGINPDEDVFYVEADGDTDDVSYEIPEDDLIDLSSGDAHSLFDLNYVKNIQKATGSDDELKLELGDDFPIKVHYDIIDGDGDVTHMIAPRIQSD